MAAACGVCLLILHIWLPQSNARLIDMFRAKKQHYSQYQLYDETAEYQSTPQIWRRDLPPDWRDKFTTSKSSTISCFPDALKFMSVVSDEKATELSTKFCQGPENVPGVLAQLYKNNAFTFKNIANLGTNTQTTTKKLNSFHSRLAPASMTVVGYLGGVASDKTKPHFVIWASDIDLEPHLYDPQGQVQKDGLQDIAQYLAEQKASDVMAITVDQKSAKPKVKKANIHDLGPITIMPSVKMQHYRDRPRAHGAGAGGSGSPCGGGQANPATAGGGCGGAPGVPGSPGMGGGGMGGGMGMQSVWCFVCCGMCRWLCACAQTAGCRWLPRLGILRWCN